MSTLVADNATNPKRGRLLNHDEVTAERWTGYLGRTSAGDRVWVNVEFTTVEVTPHSRRETVEHRFFDTGERYTKISVTGDLVEKGRRHVSACGQLHDEMADIVDPAPAFTLAGVRRFAELAAYWHLNGMRAGCAAQTPAYREGRYGREIDWVAVPACHDDETRKPYRYGSAWLIEELPSRTERWLRAFVAQLDGDERF